MAKQPRECASSVLGLEERKRGIRSVYICAPASRDRKGTGLRHGSWVRPHPAQVAILVGIRPAERV